MLLPLLLLAKDVNERFIRQNEMMNNFVSPAGLPADAYRGMLLYLQDSSRLVPEVCQWRCVRCEKGIVKTIEILPDINADSRVISMDWLPTEIEAVHISSVCHADGWVAERLPRKLRFLALWHVKLHQSVKLCKRSIDLRYLPNSLETLVLHGGWFNGILNLTHLPPFMRHLSILDTGCKKVYFDSRTFPALRNIFIKNEQKYVHPVDLYGSSEIIYASIRDMHASLAYEKDAFWPENII